MNLKEWITGKAKRDAERAVIPPERVRADYMTAKEAKHKATTEPAGSEGVIDALMATWANAVTKAVAQKKLSCSESDRARLRGPVTEREEAAARERFAKLG